MVRGFWIRLLFRTFITFLLLSLLCSSQSILNIEELSVQYGIEITNKPVLLKPQSVEENVLRLSSKHGQPYSCFLPQMPITEHLETSKGTDPEKVAEILDSSFNGTCMVHKKGWWTYKLCHKKSITQYHAGEGGEVDGVTTTLGLFFSEDDWTKEEVLRRKPSEIYHSHQYLNGTTCDVTSTPRKTTVQYFCAAKPSDNIIRVEEPATCEYIITVHSSSLCTHSLFHKKEKKQQIDLVCSPALEEHAYDKYMEKMKKQEEKAKLAKAKILEERKKKDAEDAEKAEKAKAEKAKTEHVDAVDDASEKVKGDMKDTESSLPLSKEEKKRKLKKSMDDITTFMKGFINAFNTKGGGNFKITNKLFKGGKDIKSIYQLISPDGDILDTGADNDGDKDDVDKDDDGDKDDNSNKDSPQQDVKEDEDDAIKVSSTSDNLQGDKDDKTSTTNVIKNSRDDTLPKDDVTADLDIDMDKVDRNNIDITKDLLKIFDPNLDVKIQSEIPDNIIGEELGNSESLKTINDVTESMIKQLEIDSKNMHKKAAFEQKQMQVEFERVRRNALHELDRSKNMLVIFKKLLKDAKTDKTKKDLQKKIISIEGLVESLEGQLKTIDEKKEVIEKLEKDTEKRLKHINKKILNTKLAHEFARNFERMSKEQYPDVNLFKKVDGKSEGKEKLSTNEKSDKKSVDEDEDEDGDVIPSKDPKVTSKRKKNPTLLKNMLSTVKEQLIKLNDDIKDKSDSLDDDVSNIEKNIDKTSDDTTDNNEYMDAKSKKDQSGIKRVVGMLKKQMESLGVKMKKYETDATGKTTMEDADKKASDDAKKDSMQVRIRTIDEQAFEKEFESDTENLDENTREEMKEASRKMEDAVKKQLKDAGLVFGDNIKIKIITTKDKFDKFSTGKDVKLLSDNDASDFKDMLLGFLGGGKEKISEENRQKTLEENYNFVLDDDDE